MTDRNVKILVSANTEEQVNKDIDELLGIGSVTFTQFDEVQMAADAVKPDLVVFVLDQNSDIALTLNGILTPQFEEYPVLVSICHEGLDVSNLLDRLNISSCTSSTLRERASARLSDGKFSRPDNVATIVVVAEVLKSSITPLSAAEVARQCNLSVVTCRRYLKRLVSHGKVSTQIHHKSVGRPISIYRWADAGV